MSYVPSVTTQDIVKPLQYIEEGTTAASFGVMPTSPTFVAAGINTEVSLDPDIQKEDVLTLGKLDIHEQVKTGERFAFNLKSDISDLVLANYGVNTPNGTGTIDASVAFLYSFNIDGTEQFQTMLGCRPSSTSLSVDRGNWKLDQTWVCQEITDPAASGPAGSTFITAPPSAAPITHADQADPFTWDAVVYDTSSISLSVAFDLAQLEVNGQLQIQESRAATRRITADVEVYLKDNLLWPDNNALTKVTTALIKIGTGDTATLTDSRIVDYDRPLSATATDPIKERISIESEAVAIA